MAKILRYSAAVSHMALSRPVTESPPDRRDASAALHNQSSLPLTWSSDGIFIIINNLAFYVPGLALAFRRLGNAQAEIEYCSKNATFDYGGLPTAVLSSAIVR